MVLLSQCLSRNIIRPFPCTLQWVSCIIWYPNRGTHRQSPPQGYRFGVWMAGWTSRRIDGKLAKNRARWGTQENQTTRLVLWNCYGLRRLITSTIIGCGCCLIMAVGARLISVACSGLTNCMTKSEVFLCFDSSPSTAGRSAGLMVRLMCRQSFCMKMARPNACSQ